MIESDIRYAICNACTWKRRWFGFRKRAFEVNVERAVEEIIQIIEKYDAERVKETIKKSEAAKYLADAKERFKPGTMVRLAGIAREMAVEQVWKNWGEVRVVCYYEADGKFVREEFIPELLTIIKTNSKDK